MSRKDKLNLSQTTKKIIIVVIVCFIAIVVALVWWKQSKASKSAVDTSYDTIAVTEGTISSSTLLTGTVTASQEQYVYYDASKGTQARATVSVGEQITKGQQLVQYDNTTAQATYDTAVRNLNKIGRQIDYLKTYGSLPATTSTDATNDEATTQQSANYQQQLQDLNDSYADAQSEVNKAKQALNETIIVSDVSGTVVEVNNDIDPSSKNSQVLVHVATEGQLQIKGTLTEYDLANLKTGQNVKIKSKVFPDKEWNGTISYISNYPNQATNTSTLESSNASKESASYDYKVDLNGDVSNLQQGFTVSVEVINEAKHKLVPVNAVVDKGDKSYIWVYDKNSQKSKKVEVSLGNADAKQQEILNGLEVGQLIITNPNSKLKDNQKVSAVTSDKVSTTKKSGASKE